MRKTLFLIVFFVAGCAVSPSGTEPLPLVTSETPRPLATEEPIATEEPPASTPEPATARLAVRVTKQTASVQQNDTASVTIKTKKNARCSIHVEYKSGRATAAGLGNKTADASGKITWKWLVGGNTTPGVWPINVSCDLGARSGRVGTKFRVK